MNACVHCLRPADRDIELVKVKGKAVRRVMVPFCDDCLVLRRAKSQRQVLFERIAIVNSVLLALAAGARVYVTGSSELVLHSEQGQVWAALLAALVVQIVFGIMCLIFMPWSRRFRSPETMAALLAVTIKDFDWETTSLEFGSDEYAGRFARVNPAPRD